MVRMSDVWKYVTIEKDGFNKYARAKCNFCGHEQAASATRIYQHLMKCNKVDLKIKERISKQNNNRDFINLYKEDICNIKINYANTNKSTIEENVTSNFNLINQVDTKEEFRFDDDLNVRGDNLFFKHLYKNQYNSGIEIIPTKNSGYNKKVIIIKRNKHNLNHNNSNNNIKENDLDTLIKLKKIKVIDPLESNSPKNDYVEEINDINQKTVQISPIKNYQLDIFSNTILKNNKDKIIKFLDSIELPHDKLNQNCFSQFLLCLAEY